MVELRTRKREMRADGGNHYEKLGLERILCARQPTIPDTAGTCPDLVCNFTDMRSSQPNQAGCTPDFSYPLLSSTLFSTSSLSLSFLSTTLPSLQNTKLSHSSLSLQCHDHELTLSTACTEYSLQQVQHPPQIVCVPIILMIRS